jgi:hypothetical protein
VIAYGELATLGVKAPCRSFKVCAGGKKMTHEVLYGRLRAAMLSRHFCVDRGRRVHLFSEGGVCKIPEGPNGLNALEVRPDIPLDVFNALPDTQRQAAIDAVRNRWSMLSLPERLQAREQSAERNGENPWLLFAPLALALGVEVRLGHRPTVAVLDAALDAWGRMFRSSGPFAGYPVRWDPIASEPGKEHWNGANMRSGEFPLDAQGRYDFSGRATDVRAHAYRSAAILRQLLPAGQNPNAHHEAMYGHHRHFQQWDPSQDEVVGMLALAWSAGLMSGDAALRTRAAAVLRPLATYLSSHGYLLVKPGGGLVSRGHGDSLVGAEVAIGQLFQALLGAPFAPAVDWPGAMRRAGLWESVETAWNVGGTLGTVAEVMTLLAQAGAALSAGVAAAVSPGVLAAAAGPGLATKLGRMAGVASIADVFDSYKRGEGLGDPALSAFLHQFPARQRYDVFMAVMGMAPVDAPATGFMPFLSLFALDSGDAQVRNAYQGWFNGRAAQATKLTPLTALAVACVLDISGHWEPELAARLQQAHDDFEQQHGSDLPVALTGAELTGHRLAHVEHCETAADYCGALALAWWHAQRAAAAGRSVAPGFPVLAAGTFPLPRPVYGGIGELFPNDQAPLRAPEGPTWAEEMPDTDATPDVDVALNVPANGGDIDSGETLHWGDAFRIECTGGVNFPFETGRPIGPGGHATPRLQDPAWPLHLGLDSRARAYALLGRLNGWFHVGVDSGEQRWLYRPGRSRRLFLRVNQDAAKLFASGAFRARVRIWRHPQGDPPIRITLAEARDAWLLPPHVAFSYVRPEPDGSAWPGTTTALLTLHVRLDGSPWHRVHGAALGFGAIGGPIDQVPVHGDPITIHRIYWQGATSGPDFGTTNGTYEFRIRLVVNGRTASATCSTPLRWHGDRVQCVQRGGGRITGIGGTMTDGRSWRLSVPQALAELDRGQVFFVEEPTGDRVEVGSDVTPKGRRFLRTVADGDRPNNLSRLPSCR